MEGLLWLLGFALLFYLMMRYGWYFALVWAPLYNFFAARRRT